MTTTEIPENSPALPSPKCVILYGDGFLSSSSPSLSHSHLDSLTRDGCVGLLMLRGGGMNRIKK